MTTGTWSWPTAVSSAAGSTPASSRGSSRSTSGRRGGGAPAGVKRLPPLSVLLFERLDGARPEVAHGLLAAIESGGLVLPEGEWGSFAGCIILLTTNLCAREIYEAGRQEIGFSPATDDLEDSEKARIYQLCATASEKLWGRDALGHLDDLIVFHRISRRHLPAIVRSLTADLNAGLRPRGVACRLDPTAEALLLERCEPFLRQGAWPLVRAFRRFVVFPLADLVASNRTRPGTEAIVERDAADRVRFRLVFAGASGGRASGPGIVIPVEAAGEARAHTPGISR